MVKWKFRTVEIGPNGKEKLIKLSPKQAARTDKYTEALKVAVKSTVAHPLFSNYFVKGGIRDDSGTIAGGNIEYGICQALHCEESLVAAIRSARGRTNLKNIILAISAGAPGLIASPCGNCRDIMLEDLGKDFELVCGAPKGGIAVVTTMRQYLFENFIERTEALAKDWPIACTFSDAARAMAIGTLRGNVSLTIRTGKKLENDAYSPKNIHPERRYYALIVTTQNNFFGARDVMCEYHPIYALRDAIRQARRANDPYIKQVIIVCEDFGGGAPHVMYKDRQHLHELNLQQELLLEKEINPPVYLVTYKDDGENITGFWHTNVKEWIPMCFSAGKFGPEFTKQLKKYFDNK